MLTRRHNCLDTTEVENHVVEAAEGLARQCPIPYAQRGASNIALEAYCKCPAPETCETAELGRREPAELARAFLATRQLTSWKARVASGPQRPDSSNAKARKVCFPGSKKKKHPSRNGPYQVDLQRDITMSALNIKDQLLDKHSGAKYSYARRFLNLGRA